MVLTQLEDYGFCKKGEGGAFVRSGALRMGGVAADQHLRRPALGGACRGHAADRRGRAAVAGRLSAPTGRSTDAEIALVSGHGGNQVCHSTLILGRA